MLRSTHITADASVYVRRLDTQNNALHPTEQQAPAIQDLKLAQNNLGHGQATDWHSHGINALPDELQPPSYTQSTLQRVKEALTSHTALLQPIAPVALVQRLAGDDPFNFSAVLRNDELPSVPELVAGLQQSGKDLRKDFLALTGHISHTPEEPVQIAHGTSMALRELFSPDSAAGALAIFLGTRHKGVGSNLGALTAIKTKREPPTSSGPDKHQQLSAINQQIGEQKKLLKAAPEHEKDVLRVALKKLEAQRDDVRQSLVPKKRRK